MRARNLTKPCRGKVANPRALTRLANGRHPLDDKDLATLPRRLTTDDVGVVLKEHETWSDDSLTGCERPLPTSHDHCASNTVSTCAFIDSEFEDDPFGFGFGLDDVH